MHCVLLSDYPNRETRITLYKVPPPRRERPPQDCRDNATGINSRSDACPQSQKRRGDSLDITSELRDTLPEGVSRLKPGFGGDARPTKFGNNARRKLLRAGGAMALLQGGDKRVLFLTGTLPGSTDEAMDAIARYSSYIVDRLKTWLYDNGGTSYSMYVWERQKRGALHLHYAVYIDPTERGNRIYHGFKQYWYKLLCNVSLQSGIDLFARKKGGTWRNSPKVVQAKAVWCTRTIAGYLAKYLSKGKAGGHCNDRTPTYYPVRWFGVSRPLNKLLRENTYTKEVFCRYYHEAIRFYNRVTGFLENTSDKCYSYEHKLTGSKVTVAYNPYQNGEQLWQTMNRKHQLRTNLQTSLSQEDVTTTRLRGITLKYRLTHTTCCVSLGSYCGELVERLRRFDSLNTAELMAIAHGIHYLLWWRYRDRQKLPEGYAEDVSWLNLATKALMMERQQEANQKANQDGIHG